MTPHDRLEPSEREEVRAQVRSLLEKTKAFKDLSPERRSSVANNLVRVVGFLSDPAAGHKDIATALLDDGKKPDATEQVKQNIANRLTTPQGPQKDFKAGAAQAGTQAMKDYVGAVNFPGFVSSLIQGVFQSIVDASIRQMEAYQKLLEAVVKSVDEYANDNVTQNQARDYLQSKYPGQLQIDTSSGSPKLAQSPDAESPPDFSSLGLKQTPDLSDDEGEQMIVNAARLQMAKQRQQQLSTMVLLGINRIVVTDGLINAKVIIDVKTKDTSKSTTTASSYDKKHDESSDGNGWLSSSSSSSAHDVTVSSAASDTSTSDVETKAKLTGEVRVNFKSETFPLDKMASGGDIATLNDRSAK